MLPREQATVVGTNPVAIELERFGDYWTSVCGVAPATGERRVQEIGAFLVRRFGAQAPILWRVPMAKLVAFFAQRSAHLRPASLPGVCNSLRSYVRYRARLGESTAGLAVALPRTVDWRRSTLPKAPSDAELEAFLNAFDCADPLGQRDCAIARCSISICAVTK